MSTKGVTKEISTFTSWGREDTLGYHTKPEGNKTLVNYIWCKLCAKHKDKITHRLKGAAINAAKAFTEGTNVVTKYNVS